MTSPLPLTLYHTLKTQWKKSFENIVVKEENACNPIRDKNDHFSRY